MNNKAFIGGTVALAVAALASLGAVAYLDTQRPARAETCPAQVLNSEERVRADIAALHAAADKAIARNRELVEAARREIAAMELRLGGIESAWATEVAAP